MKKPKTAEIAKSFSKLFVKNFDKEYDRFMKLTESLRYVPPERLRLPIRRNN